MITQLPDSKEKIWLTLQYFSIPTVDFLNEAGSNCLKTIDDVTFADPFEKGMAHMYIGDFAKNHNLENIAISMYYLAKEDFYNTNLDEKNKYYWQGIIYERIASAFPYKGIIQGWIKVSNYEMSAAKLFQAAGDINKYTEDVSTYLLQRSNLTYLSEYYNYDTSVTEASILKQLKTWYQDFQTKKIGTNKTAFLCYSAIGKILESEREFKSSINYFFSALLEALKEQDLYDIYYGLSEVAFAYSYLGKVNLATAYEDLAIVVAACTHYKYNYYYSLTDKATVFSILRKDDSTLVYANKVLSAKASNLPPSIPLLITFDIAALFNVGPEFDLMYETEPFSELHERAFFLKAQIFSRSNPDSATRYFSLYRRFNIRHLKEFANLLQVESDAMSGWLERVKDKEFNTERGQKLKVIALNKKILYRNRLLIIGAIILGFLIAWLVLVYYRSKEKSRKLLISTTSDLKLRSAIKNHNLGNHYAKIKILLRENRLTDAEEYCEANSVYFDSYYTTLLDEKKITLKEEADNFKLFIETEKIFKKKEIEIIYPLRNVDPSKTVFLSDVLAPLYENVLLKGFTKDRNDYRFVIEIENIDNTLCCKVSDNGEGIKNIESAIRENSYLDMLRKRLHNYFMIQNTPIIEKDVFEISSKVGEGTVINFKLPYETI